MSIDKGTAWTGERGLDALAIENGVPPANAVQAVDQPLPPALIDKLSDRVQQAEQGMRRRYMGGANEERLTGLLFAGLEDDFQVGGWRVSMRVYDHSSVVKENITGADVGVVVDIATITSDTRTVAQRVIKGLWFQAKLAEGATYDVNQLPGLRDQLNLMAEYTDQGYVAIYNPNGVTVYDPRTRAKLRLEEVLGDAFRCSRGDRRPGMLVNTMDSRLVFEALLTYDEREEFRSRWR